MGVVETSDVWSKHRQPARLLCSNHSSAMNWYATAPEWAVECSQDQDETHFCTMETNNKNHTSQAGSRVLYQDAPGNCRIQNDSTASAVGRFPTRLATIP